MFLFSAIVYKSYIINKKLKKYMNKKLFRPRRISLWLIVVVAVLVAAGIFSQVAYANHSWGKYHWARTTNPFNLNLGNNVSVTWDAYLGTTSSDWSKSLVLDTTIVTGGSTGNCLPTNGRVEVCNNVYGDNGWLGVAQIWVRGNHITQGTVKVNDTYFNNSPYNTPAWRQFVMCQEVGHIFGLDHQDVNFNNTNLGTCMDYTNDPDGTLSGQLSNEHPNAHDYDQLVTIYTHLDGGSNGKGKPANGKPATVGQSIELNDPSAWGKAMRKDSRGNNSLYERDLGNDEKLFTFVIWAN